MTDFCFTFLESARASDLAKECAWDEKKMGRSGGGGEGELEGREKASLTPAPYFSHPLAVSFFSRFACFFGNP